MADLSIASSSSVEISGETFGSEYEGTFTMTAPEKAYKDIISTSTTITDIPIGATLTWGIVRVLVLKNLSTTVVAAPNGENIGIYKGAVLMAVLKPGEEIRIFTAGIGLDETTPDTTAYRYDANAGTPRMAITVYGPMTAA